VLVGVLVGACWRTNAHTVSMRAVRDRVVQCAVHDSTLQYLTVHYSDIAHYTTIRTEIYEKTLISVEFFPVHNKNESDYI
jgi:hypothetical protein